MDPPRASSLAQRSHKNHVMLLYEDEKSRANAAVDCINEGLGTGALCIYASIDAFNHWTTSHISNLSNKISNYERNIEEGNLEIINFRPYYESALGGEILPFKQLKSHLEDALIERRSKGKADRIMIFADAACELSRNRKFSECEVLEKWWNDAHKEWLEKDLDITVICPHPGRVLKDKSVEDKKFAIGSCHSTTLDLDKDFPYLTKSPAKSTGHKSISVLIAESEPDLQGLYADYFDSIGIDVTVVDSGLNCIECIRRQRKAFDMIILDTHLNDSPGIEVAKKIREINPIQRIVLTSTYSPDQIKDDLASIGFKREDILQKPFTLSQLLSTVRPANFNN